MMKRLLIVIFFVGYSIVGFAANKHLPPNPFGPSVIVFDPSMSAGQINSTIAQIYDKQRFNEFGNERYALLFMPGVYGNAGYIDVRVGYYMQVLGLGQSPDDTLITGAVRTQDAPPSDPNHPDYGPGALTNFWRSAENLAVIPTLGSISYPDAMPKDQNVWAVSQAAPMRRMHIRGTLRLFDIGWSSGGFLSNSLVDNTIISGSQQQWFTRNSSFMKWQDGNWNMVLLGSTGQLPGTWPTAPFTAIDQTPLVREKPFLFIDPNTNNYAVMVPNLRAQSVGVDWNSGVAVPISDFYIAQPSSSTAASINNALEQGKHIIFTPGVYHLEDTIYVRRENTIILGIGLPSLINDTNRPAMIISDVDGVSLAGVLFDAGTIPATTVIQVGETTNNVRHVDNPTFLFDVFCRVGGTQQGGRANSCMTINSNDVYGDYFWLWRADHGTNITWTSNPSDTGLIVNGQFVTIYGLMVEHFQKYQTIWNGNNGRVYFYQSEIPYDPPSQAEWMNGDVNGYASYKVANHVRTHDAWGLGVYSFFRDANYIFAESGIEAPMPSRGIHFTHMVSIWLDGYPDTGITHVINNIGDAVMKSHPKSTVDAYYGFCRQSRVN